MRKLTVFNFISLDGYYKDVNDGIAWHTHDAEEGEFSAKNANSGSTLLFGRVTYEMMASFWPSQQAMTSMPEIANGMNKTEKIVFSRTMEISDWNNTSFMKGNIVEEVKKLKQTPGIGMTILGSGNIVSQFTDAGIIDEYQIMITPVALGAGTPIFKGLKNQLRLKLTNSKTFKNGVVLLTYVPQES